MKFKGISRNVVALGWVSFCTDLASEMLYPVMPLFVVGVLGASPAALGLIDGIAEGVSSGLRWLGGALSDRYRRRKPFVFLGYTLSALSKPIMGLSQIAVGWPIFLLGRVSDRFGKSIRTSARDALIADSTESEHRGRAFGFHRMMDTCGAVLGPLITLVIVMAMAGVHATFAAKWRDPRSSITALPLKWLFYFAVIPGIFSAMLVLALVREIRPADARGGGPPRMFQTFGRPFWNLIVANAIFSIGNSSDSFLLLRSGELGLGFAAIILAYALYNTVFAAAATPLGNLSDRIGRKPVVACGWIVYAAVYGGFAVCGSTLAPWVLLGIYGLYQAFTDGVAKAMVTDLVPSAKRAGAIGLFYTVSGVGSLLGSLITGGLWNVRIYGNRISLAFAIPALFALTGAVVILGVKRPAMKSDA